MRPILLFWTKITKPFIFKFKIKKSRAGSKVHFSSTEMRTDVNMFNDVQMLARFGRIIVNTVFPLIVAPGA